MRIWSRALKLVEKIDAMDIFCECKPYYDTENLLPENHLAAEEIRTWLDARKPTRAAEGTQ